MLTIMCPNCRHRFPASGCCSADTNGDNCRTVFPTATTTTTLSFDHPLLPTSASGGLLLVDTANVIANFPRQQVTISTKCGIQSGGCLIQTSNAEVMLQSTEGSTLTTNTSLSPGLEVRSKLSGGGSCLIQKKSLSPEPCTDESLLIDEEELRNSFERAAEFHRSHSTTTRLDSPPSGYQEQLPGNRRDSPVFGSCECRCYCKCCFSYCRGGNDFQQQQKPQQMFDCRGNPINCRHTSCPELGDNMKTSNSGNVEIQVNATVRLPSSTTTTTTSVSMGSCTVSIVASTSRSADSSGSSSEPGLIINRPPQNNFNGGGIVSFGSSSSGPSNFSDPIITTNFSSIGARTENNNTNSNNNFGREDTAPGTPVSWLTPCPPWSFDTTYLPEQDVAKLAEIRKMLQTCGWYYEGLSWQQSENLLKDAPVGRWLMRDSSDNRYTFAISVQTTRGPTSVRVYYCMGKFRLDAEPRLALTMPLFDCPIKMVEYYREYSKQRMDKPRQEVWVDFSGQVYSQIYMAEPLLKEIRSLSQMARIVVNQNSDKLKKNFEKLPPVIRNYINEYPYTL